MANSIGKNGGQNGKGYVEDFDDGSIVVSDGSTSATLTRALLTSILSAAAYLTGLVIDYTTATTGAAYVSLKTNLASAWAVKVGSTALIDFVTTTNKVFVKLGGRLKFAAATTVTMSNAAHALVLGTAGAGQTQLAGRHVKVTPGGTGLTLTLPTAADCDGLELVILNAGSDTFTVAGILTASVAQSKAAVAYCDGTYWYAYAIG